MRAQIMRYNDRDFDASTGNDTFIPDSFEMDSANEDGYFDGFLDGYVGEG